MAGGPVESSPGSSDSERRDRTDPAQHIACADGSTQTTTLGFSDWTLAAGAEAPQFGNVIAITTPHRNNLGGPQTVKTFLFATAPTQLSPGKGITSMSLPGRGSGGQMHVFAIGTSAAPAQACEPAA